MREGRIILPHMDNEQNSLARVFEELAVELEQRYGGVTVSNGYGFWGGSREPIWILDVAYEPSRQEDDALIALATQAGIKGKQHSMYVRLASGEVLIPEMSPLVQAVA